MATRARDEWRIGLTWAVAMGVVIAVARLFHPGFGVVMALFWVALIGPAWWWNRGAN